MRVRDFLSAAVVTVILLAPAPALAGETVKISGLHLCCGGCVSAVDEALGDIDGVSDVEVDQELRTVTFEADDDQAVEAAGQAILNAGFFGELTRGGKKSPLPVPDNGKIVTGAKSDRATFDNVHLCCKNCSRGVTNSLAKLREVVAVDCDTKAHTVTLTGKDMDLAAVATALQSAGFYGTLRRDNDDNTARAKSGSANRPTR